MRSVDAGPFGQNLPQLKSNVAAQNAGDVRADAARLRERAEGSSMYATPVFKRAIYLTSDAIVLTLASPFFLAWWAVKALRRFTHPK